MSLVQMSQDVLRETLSGNLRESPTTDLEKTMEDDIQMAHEMGRDKSILENPFWKDYPKNPESHEADLGRHFVDGWASCQKQ